ncbi:MAG: bile acid:sodium symporter family protein [Thioalkalispiraceae bacterium]|jgi:BASS family bile acid:Na+ symporter
MVSILRFIATYMAFLTLIAALVAFTLPDTFLVFGSIFKELFAATMFSLGVVLDRKDLVTTLRRPAQIVLGVCTQFIVMPLLAYTIVTLAGLPPSLALGFIIVGSAPGAMASNVIVYLARGALAYSIALTTVATFLAPLLTPLLIDLLANQTIAVDPAKLMWTIFYILVIPLAGGMLMRFYLDKGFAVQRFLLHVTGAAIMLALFSYFGDFQTWQILLAFVFLVGLPLAASQVKKDITLTVLSWAKEIAPAIASLSIIIICAFAVAKNQASIAKVGTWVLLLVILLNALGYLAGWLLAKLYRFDKTHQITLAIEIGMQNAGMGVALALAHFQSQPEVALPGALFAVWCIITAAGASTYFRHKNAREDIQTSGAI